MLPCCAGVSGLILVTAVARGAEPQRPASVHRPWLRTAPHAARAEPRVDVAASSAEPGAAAEGFERRGFFTRLALGSGVFSAGSGSARDTRSFLGLPVSFEAYLGGTPSPYLSLGGGYARDAVGRLSSTDERNDGDEPRLDDTSFYLEQLAAFLELYPSASSPYYGFVTLGMGTLNVRKTGDDFELPLFSWASHLAGADPSGVIATLGGGYESWIAKRWALGISMRVLVGVLSSEEIGTETAVNVLMPSLLLTLSYR